MLIREVSNKQTYSRQIIDEQTVSVFSQKSSTRAYTSQHSNHWNSIYFVEGVFFSTAELSIGIVRTVAFRNLFCLHMNVTHFLGFNNNVYCGSRTRSLKMVISVFMHIHNTHVCQQPSIHSKSIKAPGSMKRRKPKCGIDGMFWL